MKSRIYWNWGLGLTLAVMSFSGGDPRESLSQPTNTAPAPQQEVAPDVAPQAAPEPDPALAEPPAEDEVVTAAVQPISTAKPLPPSIKLTPAVAEVVKLADSGLDESVLLSFVTNSTSTFNLGAEEIIYLNDIGISSAVVTAMIQRDQELKQLAANAAPAAVAPGPPAPEPAPVQPEPAPAPAEMAPQPAETAESYAPPPVDASYATFYDSLAPYGSWVDVSGYGPCWQPTVVVVNPGWRPYCDSGRWVYTDCGWYWSSGYSWGWAPFHYGRWFRHQNMGWCWAPGTQWGPSWVSWRYSGDYCGWAPLPPAAGFSVGFGLTYRGQNVNSGCSFGLGVSSYSFVNVSHFSNPRVGHYAVPHAQARQIYHQSVPSTTIVRNRDRVINHGIPVSRVAAATRTQIHPVGIRDGGAPTAHGTRGERFDNHSRTLSVYRPHFPQATGTQPATDGRAQSGRGSYSRSDGSSRNSGALVTPTPGSTTPRVAPGSPTRTAGSTTTTQPSTVHNFGRRTERPGAGATPAPTVGTVSAPRPPLTTTRVGPEAPAQTSGRTTTTQPSSTQNFSRRSERPSAEVTPAPTVATSPTPTASRQTITTTPRTTAPLILHGTDRNDRTTAGRSATTINQASAPNSTVARGQQESSQWQSANRRATPVTEAPQSRSMPTRADTSSRPAATQRSQPFQTAEAQQLSQPRAYTPRAVQPAIRTEPARPVTAPSYSAPVQTPRSAPAPTPAPQVTRSYSPPTPQVTRSYSPPTPQATRSYSPPTPSPAPRAQVTESRQSYSAPSPSSGSSGSSYGGRSQSSGGRGGR